MSVRAPKVDGLTYVHNAMQSSRSLARQHILSPFDHAPSRTVCGVELTGSNWAFLSKVHSKLCANCARMRSSALEQLKSIRDNKKGN